jgi:hypothetical protein
MAQMKKPIAKGSVAKTFDVKKLMPKMTPQDAAMLKILKKKLALKYNMPEDSVITYDEMMKIPVGDKPKWNVIVKPGDGDDSANRSDVVGTWLLIH